MNDMTEGYGLLLASFHQFEADFKSSLDACRKLLDHYYDRLKIPAEYRGIIVAPDEATKRRVNEEMKKYEGRKYYAVSILYDKSKELFEMDYAARVCIWADDGTPWSIETGNGMGCEFLTIPFERYIKSKEFREIPYQQIDSDLQKYHKK